MDHAFIFRCLYKGNFMKVPPRMSEALVLELAYEEVIMLLKVIYNLVQAARQWFQKTAHKMLGILVFKKRKGDTCLVHRSNRLVIIICFIYMDDVLVVSGKASLQDVK